MKSIFASIWFWILAIGFLLILIAALIGGGMKKINGWVWGLFIIGIILFILGIIFAFVEKGCSKTSDRSLKTCETNKMSPSKCVNFELKESSITSTHHSILASPSIPFPVFANSSPMTSGNLSSSNLSSSNLSPSSLSPMGSPTKISCNVPQAMRGFVTTSSDLSSLAPN